MQWTDRLRSSMISELSLPKLYLLELGERKAASGMPDARTGWLMRRVFFRKCDVSKGILLR